MNIAIIGTGQIGGGLCKAWVRAGHRIFLGTRNPLNDAVRLLVQMDEELVSAHAPEVAASKADVVLLAVPADKSFQVVSSLGDTRGKIIIDAMNAVFRKPEGFDSTHEAIVKAGGNDHIVKAFNMIGAENMSDPVYDGIPADLFICGAYAEDKVIVSQLAADAGFRVFDVGGQEMSLPLEHLAMLWGRLAFSAGLGRNIAFKVLQR